MADFKTPEPPETFYQATVHDLKSVIYGIRNDLKDKGIQILTGKEVKETDHPLKSHFYFEDEEHYLLLYKVKIAFGNEINLSDLGKNGKPKLHFFIYQSILPTISLNDSIISEIQFNKSQAGDISIDNNSQAGKISIYNNSQAGDISIDNNSQAGDIWINNNSQAGDISIYKNSQSGNVWIYDNSQAGDISIDNHSQAGDISIYDNSQAGDIWIDNHSQAGNIWIDNHSQAGDIWIDNHSQAGSISIYKNSQAGSISIYKNSQAGYISIYNNSQAGDISIYKNSQAGYISIYDSSVKSILLEDAFIFLKASNSTIPLIRLNDCHLQKLSWQSGSKGELYMNGGSINHLCLEKTALLKDTVFGFTDVGIHVLQMEEVLVQGQLMLRSIASIEEQKISNWNPSILNGLWKKRPKKDATNLEKKIFNAFLESLKSKRKSYRESIKQLKENFKGEKALLRIANSSLGKTEITGGDLTGFHFEYRDSKLLECFISGSQLPKEAILIYKSAELGGLHEQKVGFYNQMRKLYDNMGDIVEASWYQSKAMYHQQQLLSIEYARKRKTIRWWQVRKWPVEAAFNIFNFKLNRLSNNHGESWRTALWFTLLVTLSIYSLYYASLFYNKDWAWSGVSSFFGDYFSFLDITHKQNFLVEKPEPLAKGLDFFGRIATGYCLYQFIAAFRRHGRKAV